MPEKPEKKPSKEDLLVQRLERMEGQLQTLVQAQQSLTEVKSDSASRLEDLPSERLERMEGQLQTLVKSQQSLKELQSDISPLLNSAFKIFIDELGTVESGFQLEDFWELLKRVMRSMRNITYGLEQMEAIINLWHDIEPMLKSTIPNFINYLDNLERKGVFRTYVSMLEVRAKVAAHYSAEEISSLGDSFVLLLSMLKKLSSPEMINFMNRILELPMEIKLEEVKPLGPLGILSSMRNKETQQGIAVALELTKALGKLGPPEN